MKRIAPDHAVDADELLRKVPDLFPVYAATQKQIDAFQSEFLLRTETMTVAERAVCMAASYWVEETMWKNILNCARREKVAINS